jgi:mannose-6-phosphate isomerase-like protein (cupin superfamily)
MTEHHAINFAQKLSLFDELWSPKVVAEMNDYQFKLSKVRGEFVWHSHPNTDEAFLLLAGRLTIELRDGAVELAAGEMYVVRRGVEHRPVSAEGCSILIIEPKGTPNTGDSGGAMTAPQDVWI